MGDRFAHLVQTAIVNLHNLLLLYLQMGSVRKLPCSPLVHIAVWSVLLVWIIAPSKMPKYGDTVLLLSQKSCKHVNELSLVNF